MREFKLAICDDQQCFIDDVKQYMKAYESEKKSQFTISEYHSGEELLEEIGGKGLVQDILFLDVDMPGKKGIDVAKEIRERYQNAVICFNVLFLSPLMKIMRIRHMRHMRWDIF